MIWYYMNGEGQQVGPMEDAEFNGSVESGVIHAATPVWNEKLPAWVKYSEAGNTSTGKSLAIAAPPARCAECGKEFAQSEMVNFDGVWVCASCKPLFVQKLREGVAAGSFGIGWRAGKRLVMPVNTDLPKRCIKCNGPTGDEQIRRKLYWHHPAIYLSIVLRVVPYLILALIFRKKSVNFISVCQQHRSARRLAVVVTWLICVAGIGLLSYGAATVDNHGAYLPLAGTGLILVSLIFGILRARYVYPTKITKEYIWMGGCCREFLAEFPEWTGPK